MTHVSISAAAFALMVADGQLDNAIREERRWRQREDEARDMRQAAEEHVAKWQRRINEIKEHCK